MTDQPAPKRPRGRPRVPGALTGPARKKASVQARRVSRVELPGDALDALDAIARRHGDPSRAAALARLICEAHAQAA